jgi:hypothetical protein
VAEREKETMTEKATGENKKFITDLKYEVKKLKSGERKGYFGRARKCVTH